MATRNYRQAREEGWTGLLDNDEQVYVTRADLMIIGGSYCPEKWEGRTRKVTLGNMCEVEVPDRRD